MFIRCAYKLAIGDFSAILFKAPVNICTENVVWISRLLFITVNTIDLCKYRDNQCGPRSAPALFLIQFKRTMKQTTFVEVIWSNVVLNICPLRSFPTFLSSAYFFVLFFFFPKSTFSKKSFRNTIRMSNSLDPGRAWSGSELFQKLLTDDTRRKKS